MFGPVRLRVGEVVCGLVLLLLVAPRSAGQVGPGQGPAGGPQQLQQLQRQQQQQQRLQQQQQMQVATPRGTIAAIGGGMVRIAGEDGSSWTVLIGKGTQVQVTGTATPESLGPGVCIEFTANVVRQGRVDKVQEKVKQLKIFTPTEQYALGAFPETGFDTPLEPAVPEKRAGRRTAQNDPPAAVRYTIRGRITAMKKSVCNVAFSGGHLEVELDDQPEIAVSASDFGCVRQGDKITCTGILVRPFVAQAHSAQVELAAPLGGGGQDPRRGRGSAGKAAEKTPDQTAPLDTAELVTLLTPKDAAEVPESFSIEGDPTVFRPCVQGPAITLQRRFGQAKTSPVKGVLTVGQKKGSEVHWQIWTWGSVKVVVDASRKTRFFAADEAAAPEGAPKAEPAEAPKPAPAPAVPPPAKG